MFSRWYSLNQGRATRMLAVWMLSIVLHQVALGSTSTCDQAMMEKCTCGRTMFEGTLQFVVNCTNAGFNNAYPLQHLPPDTEVLIFQGNNITELPWNVFGTENYLKIRVVDMSNNQIRKILGKSYHKVSNVQRLILNHNQISIADQDHHPRIFSNFINLQELHLTNAFEDNADNLGIDLHGVFVGSNLTKLIKLHLEQNEVTHFKDREVFCDLPNIIHLYLGSNSLRGIDFRIDCLNHLSFIDLEGNNITRLSKAEFEALDELPSRNQNLSIDLTDNPFSCECGIEDLFCWLNSTKVDVRNSNLIKCHRPDDEIPGTHPYRSRCSSDVAAILVTFNDEKAHTAGTILGFLLVIIFSIVSFMIYTNRKAIRKRFQPMVDTVSRKVHYSTISPSDDQEVDV